MLSERDTWALMILHQSNLEEVDPDVKRYQKCLNQFVSYILLLLFKYFNYYLKFFLLLFKKKLHDSMG